MDALLWFLLPVAAISGWVAAFKHFKSLNSSKLPDVYHSATYRRTARQSDGDNNVSKTESLVDTQPDKAVDLVIDKVEVNADTVEVHLALGNLYRRSGEVSRAIRFHQNLSEKHSLSHSQRENILFELGRDYLSAGLLDRAERIFKDLLTADEFKIKSSKALVEVFQQEKEWSEALEYAEMYERLSKKSQKTRIAHYYCEMAEKLMPVSSLDANDYEEARAFLYRALKKDKSCVRANIALGDINLGLSEYDEALKHYVFAVEQDRAFLSVVFDNLIQSSQLVTKNVMLGSLLPGASVVGFSSPKDISLLESADFLVQQKQVNQEKVMKYIEQKLDKTPTLSLLGKYLHHSVDDSFYDSKLNSQTKNTRKATLQLNSALSKIAKTNASHKCVSCGLGVHFLQWQCPSCSNWSTIKPL